LGVVFLAHVEGDGVLVWGQVGSGAIAAGAVEVEGSLRASVECLSILPKLRSTYSITVVGRGSSSTDKWASVPFALAPLTCDVG
jgi:hypothetical protein